MMFSSMKSYLGNNCRSSDQNTIKECKEKKRKPPKKLRCNIHSNIISKVETKGRIELLDEDTQIAIIDHKYTVELPLLCHDKEDMAISKQLSVGTLVNFTAVRTTSDVGWVVTEIQICDEDFLEDKDDFCESQLQEEENAESIDFPKPAEGLFKESNVLRGKNCNVIQDEVERGIKKIDLDEVSNVTKDSTNDRIVEEVFLEHDLVSKEMQAKVTKIERGFLTLEGLVEPKFYEEADLNSVIVPEYDLFAGDLVILNARVNRRNGAIKEIESIMFLALMEKSGPVRKQDGAHVIHKGSVLIPEQLIENASIGGKYVTCKAVMSESSVGTSVLKWRAVSLSYSSLGAFQRLTAEIPEPDDHLLQQMMSLYKPSEYIRVEPSFIKFPTVKVGSKCSTIITLHNKSERSIMVSSILINLEEDPSDWKINAERESCEYIALICEGSSYSFEVEVTPTLIGKTQEMLLVEFRNIDPIAKTLSVIATHPDEELLDKLNPEKPEYESHFRSREDREELIRMSSSKELVLPPRTVLKPFFGAFFKPYTVKREVLEAILLKDEGKLIKLYPNFKYKLSINNYKSVFHIALWMEEIAISLNRAFYSMKNVSLKQFKIFYVVKVPQIDDIKPKLTLNDICEVIDSKDSKRYQGRIQKIDGNNVYLLFTEDFDSWHKQKSLSLTFKFSRASLARQHYAADAAVDRLGAKILFPTKLCLREPRINITNEPESENSCVLDSPGPDVLNHDPGSIFGTQRHTEVASENDHNTMTPKRQDSFIPRTLNTDDSLSQVPKKVKWFNHKLNAEQKNAVKRILKARARPLPYVIYGPPGTGKTSTLIEAVMQVNKLDQNSRILICAPSNSAADLITERLVQSNHYCSGQLARFNGYYRSQTRSFDGITEFSFDAKQLSRVFSKDKCKILISTCVNAAQLLNDGMKEGIFSHVFVDEAGQASETETLIPFLLLNIKKGGQCVLSGDHNQLGTLVQSISASNLGLHVSLIERLMTLPLYKKEEFAPGRKQYNPNLITKLVQSYRSVKSILKIPSQMFYDNELISHASAESIRLADDVKICNSILCRKGFPIVFEGVQGMCKLEKGDTSWYNVPEVLVVLNYIKRLMGCSIDGADIGVITLYRKQVSKIQSAVASAFPKGGSLPKIGTVEEFQGREKKVIILSTVRSHKDYKISNMMSRLRFAFCTKRFNVAVTRAKSLLIIVGDPFVFCKEPCWESILKYCISEGGYKGCTLPVGLDPVKLVKLDKILKKSKKQHEEESSKLIFSDSDVSSEEDEF